VLELGSDGSALCLGDGGAREEVLVDLVGPVKIGDTLLVHAGVALLRLDGEAAAT
jgi:hydrogenase maturation factor